MRKAIIVFALAILSACATSSSTSRLIRSNPSPETAEYALARAEIAIGKGQWELANSMLLTALDHDPALARDAHFMRQLADSAREMGIGDFYSEVYSEGHTP